MKQPVSKLIKEEYIKKLDSARGKQHEDMAKRIESNRIYSEQAIAKIIDAVRSVPLAHSEDGVLQVEAEPNYMVAILIRSTNGINPKAKKCLKLLRLSKINQCVIIRNNECNRQLLKTASGYLAYGFVKYALLRKLVYLRGTAILRTSLGGKKRIALDNETIETAFEGKYRCIEELLYAIYNGSEDVKKIIRFLAPINLSCPRGGFSGKKKDSVVKGGASGNHRELLCELLDRMI